MAGTKRRKGRPGKLTPEVAKALVTATAEGLPRRSAAAVAGVSRSTFLAWLKLGQGQRRGPFRSLLVDVRRAEALVIRRHMLNIARVAFGGERTVERLTRADGSVETIEAFMPANWRASAWLLERRFPEMFGRSFRVPRAAGSGSRKYTGPMVLLIDKTDGDHVAEEE